MKYLVLDCNYLCHRAAHSTKGLRYKNQDTGVLYGFLEALVNLTESFDTKNVIFIWDSRGSFRKEVFPDYKKKRHTKERTEQEKKERKSCFAQMDILQHEIIPSLGFKNNWLQENLEGDDLMAQVAIDYGHDFVLIASDKDLYQLLSDRVRIFVPNKGFYTEGSLKDEYGVTPKQWRKVKSIGGCSSDEVPGIAGVGELTACKYLTGQLKETYQVYKKIVSQEGKDLEKFNRQLVWLPHKKTQPVKIKKDKCKYDKFKTMCRKYGFKSFLKERNDEWHRLLDRPRKIRRRKKK